MRLRLFILILISISYCRSSIVKDAPQSKHIRQDIEIAKKETDPVKRAAQFQKIAQDENEDLKFYEDENKQLADDLKKCNDKLISVSKDAGAGSMAKLLITAAIAFFVGSAVSKVIGFFKPKIG